MVLTVKRLTRKQLLKQRFRQQREMMAGSLRGLTFAIRAYNQNLMRLQNLSKEQWHKIASDNSLVQEVKGLLNDNVRFLQSGEMSMDRWLTTLNWSTTHVPRFI